MPDNPHILLLPTWYPTAETPVYGVFVKEQAVALRDAGVRVGVIYPEHHPISSLGRVSPLKNHFQTEVVEDAGIPTIRQHSWNLLPGTAISRSSWQASAVKLYEAYVRQFGKPDLIHAHSILRGGIGASAIKERFGVPFVVTEHASAFNRNLVRDKEKDGLKRAFSEADAVICVGKGLLAQLEESGLIERRSMVVVPNIVDTDYFTAPDAARREEPYWFVTVGMLTKNKGTADVLRAFAHAFQSKTSVRLAVVGDGPEREALVTLAEELGIRDQVEFRGQLSREDLRNNLWSANAYVHGSFYETFGLSLAEAMSTGLPVASTACGGPEEIVGPGTGMLTPVGAPEALGQAMKQIRDEKSRFSAEEIRSSVVSRYSRAAVCESLLSIYRTVLQNRK